MYALIFENLVGILCCGDVGALDDERRLYCVYGFAVYDILY